MRMFVPITLCLLFSLYLAFHMYASFFVQFHKWKAVITITLIIFFIFFSIILLLAFSTVIPNFLLTILEIVIYSFVIFFLYAAIFYFILDLIRIFITIQPFKVSVIALSLALLALIFGYINTRFIRENRYQIESDKISQDTKIVMISDLHIGSLDMTLSKMAKMVKKINQHHPDLIIMAGDVLDDASVDFKKLGYLPYFENLKAKHGTFITLGNHEYYRGSVQSVITDFKSLPHTELLDDRSYFIKDLNLNLIGLSDKGLKRTRKTDLSHYDLKPNAFQIVVEHNPIFFKENTKHPFDLQLSGHTHAGQIILGYLIELFMYEKPWGLLKKELHTLITSCGIGTWGPPVRDISYPEIIIIDLKKS